MSKSGSVGIDPTPPVASTIIQPGYNGSGMKAITAPTAKRPFTTISGVPIEPLYGPEHLKDLDPAHDLGEPGQFPYTRGIHESMYRGRLWTMRQFSGFATPEETNRRYHYLLEQGLTGLSVAFDLPTLMGYDSDHMLAEGEVGKCGVAISSLEDMEALFRGIPLGDVTVSMTINSPAAVLWAMYLAVAEKQGVDWTRLSGTLQNDILKEYIAQKEYIFPPRPSMRLVTDTIEFGAEKAPRFNPISISGYHIREAGSTAVQELAFTLRDGIEYVEWALARGLAVDTFAPRLSFFFNAHNDFFEEIAKYRAARKLWSYIMRDRFGATSERSLKLRFHAQTAGCSLTWQQPYNNIVRTTIQALAAVLGGCQSLHTNSLDEAYALPSEHAVTIALRTQQVIAYESGVTGAPDPLGGSYFLERLTLDTEEAARDYICRIDEMGGMIAAIEKNFPQREIANASYEYQKAVELGEKLVVGVNAFQSDGAEPIEILQIDRSARERQAKKLAALRSKRDNGNVRACLDALKRAAEGTANTMPFILDAVRAYATLGEICDALREVFGSYQETSLV
jgi:methylmalonyl-CoA mutase, N-terminal domain